MFYTRSDSDLRYGLLKICLMYGILYDDHLCKIDIKFWAYLKS
jgi:hypothetical protein